MFFFPGCHVAPNPPRLPAAVAEVRVRGLLDLRAEPAASPAAATAAELQQPREEQAAVGEQHRVRVSDPNK